MQHLADLALLAQAITYGVQLVGNIGGISGSDFAIKDETVKAGTQASSLGLPWVAWPGIVLIQIAGAFMGDSKQTDYLP